jgi:hypothetical protein
MDNPGPAPDTGAGSGPATPDAGAPPDASGSLPVLTQLVRATMERDRAAAAAREDPTSPEAQAAETRAHEAFIAAYARWYNFCSPPVFFTQ